MKELSHKISRGMYTIIIPFVFMQLKNGDSDSFLIVYNRQTSTLALGEKHFSYYVTILRKVERMCTYIHICIYTQHMCVRCIVV